MQLRKVTNIQPRHICVIGTGYVGLVTGSCFADLGNVVVCVDHDEEKVRALSSGRIPFHEPGLPDLVVRNLLAGRLTFTKDIAAAIEVSDIIFITVGTPADETGEADISAVEEVAVEIGKRMTDKVKVVVNKSTVPAKTAEAVWDLVQSHKPTNSAQAYVVSNPEFLREGNAISDFMRPDRVVIGSTDAEAIAVMRALYRPIDAAVIVTDPRSAEMIKYTANAFLAMRVSFINEIASLCEDIGADVKAVAAGAGSDRRIGQDFLEAGLGYGGSCFPKDVLAIYWAAQRLGVETPLLKAIMDVNSSQIGRAAKALNRALGGLNNKQIAVLGLAFKPNTDDVRYSPSLALARRLLESGARIAVCDPVALENARQVLPPSVVFAEDVYEAASHADAVVLATEWLPYRQMDLLRLKDSMAGRIFYDARNAMDPARVTELGFTYVGFARGANDSELTMGLGRLGVK